VSRTSSSLRPSSRSTRPTGGASRAVSLRLLAGFGVDVRGDPVQLPASAQRVVAFVALHERALLRPYAAGSLWLDWPEARAAGNLRSALWRVQRVCPTLIDADARMLRLGRGVQVDLRDAESLARDELSGACADDVRAAMLSLDLLPDWYDDWVLIERERFRQLRLRALEARCDRLAAQGRLDEALEAGLLALAGEPLRESAHRALVRVHLAEGNVAEAIRQFRLCRRLLGEQLGVEPSARMLELVRGLDAANTDR
jgi:DNA-binding SARP family transcriptional activator